MSKAELPPYLNDYLAGSVGALELVDHLIETYKGKPLEEFFQNLRAEIEVAAIDAGKTSPDHLRLGAPALNNKFRLPLTPDKNRYL
jgi:hypothetical protein